jgi:hypothetical protein
MLQLARISLSVPRPRVSATPPRPLLTEQVSVPGVASSAQPAIARR